MRLSLRLIRRHRTRLYVPRKDLMASPRLKFLPYHGSLCWQVYLHKLSCAHHEDVNKFATPAES